MVIMGGEITLAPRQQALRPPDALEHLLLTIVMSPLAASSLVVPRLRSQVEEWASRP